MLKDKPMEYKVFKKKNKDELNKLLGEAREIKGLRFKDANKQLKNVREIRQSVL
jgi:ribosomal protein L29